MVMSYGESIVFKLSAFNSVMSHHGIVMKHKENVT